MGRLVSCCMRAWVSQRFRTRKLKPLHSTARPAGRQAGSEWCEEEEEQQLQECSALNQADMGLANPLARRAPSHPTTQQVPAQPLPLQRSPAGAHQQLQEGQHVRHQVHHPAKRVLQNQARDVWPRLAGGIGSHCTAERAPEEDHSLRIDVSAPQHMSKSCLCIQLQALQQPACEEGQAAKGGQGTKGRMR